MSQRKAQKGIMRPLPIPKLGAIPHLENLSSIQRVFQFAFLFLYDGQGVDKFSLTELG